MPPLKLEIFQLDRPSDPPAPFSEGTHTEEARLVSFEQGYAAGWEDCSKAEQDDQHRLSTELARNLQAMSFTYHEARDHVLRAIGPLLHDITLNMLPVVAREALGPLVLETLLPKVEAAANLPVEILVNPTMVDRVAALLETTAGMPARIRPEPSIGEGQVRLIFRDSETRIDLDRATAEISGAVHDFFKPSERDRKHG